MSTAATQPAVARRPTRRMPLITADYLRALGADCEDLAIFSAEWPQGTRVTRKALRRAAELHLDLGWFAHQALTDARWCDYFALTEPSRGAWAETDGDEEDDARLDRARADAIFAVLKEFPDALKVAP